MLEFPSTKTFLLKDMSSMVLWGCEHTFFRSQAIVLAFLPRPLFLHFFASIFFHKIK